ncbi:hypothetical protein LLE49_27030 [Alicyclobacillus tolerans]|uniref:hypothetical protein n=1 Tax=Alicyclobacillus tolerans TaxID=90970 RepID=UPI001F33E7F0|nr:hypothetical protein [Alicyclobacillus tolerans]MCF8568377.1 hypothetical protein [Alicyclobacillus tolerans]
MEWMDEKTLITQLKNAQNFYMSAEAEERILERIRSTGQAIGRRHRPRKYTRAVLESTIAGLLAGAAIFLIGTNPGKTVLLHTVRTMGAVQTISPQNGTQTSILQGSEGSKNLETEHVYSGLAGVLEHATFKIKEPTYVPSGLPPYTVHLYETKGQMKFSGNGQTVTFETGKAKTWFTVSEIPDSNGQLLRSAISPQEIRTVNFHGVDVQVAIPQKDVVHQYSFVVEGIYYNVTSQRSYADSITAEEDTNAWKIINSLIDGHHYLS